jgi:DMSO reductase family type II enzyme chaperone
LAQRLPFDFAGGEPHIPELDDLQQSYVSTFEVGIGRPFCPLYEGSFRSGRMKLMEDLVRFYEHFGLRPEAGDHPDHLCAELEFMHYLAFKEALRETVHEPVDDLRRAQRDFLDRHLCRWIPRLRARLKEAADLPDFYVLVSELADEFCRRDLPWLRKMSGKAAP